MADEKTSQFQLKITIVSGEGLLGCDKGDVSDPYVKISQDETVLFKTSSKDSTVNPVWNEDFTVQSEDVKKPFLFQVFDKDKMSFDDFMGQAELNLADCKLNQSCYVELQLEAANDKKLLKKTKKDEQCLGKITVNIKVYNNGCPQLPPNVAPILASESNQMVEEVSNLREDHEKQQDHENGASYEEFSSIKAGQKNMNDYEDDADEKKSPKVIKINKENVDHDTVSLDNVSSEKKVKDKDGDANSAFLLKVTIISAEDLQACDKGDVSDPYVKLCQDETVLFKTSSKDSTVNPVWNEGFTVQVEDIKKPYFLQVFDKDKFSFDDFMGQAELNLANCTLNESLDVSFHLLDGNDKHLIEKMKKTKQSLGKINVNINLSSIDKAIFEETKEEDKSFFKTFTNQFSLKEKAPKQHIAIVHVVLVQGRALTLMQGGTDCDPYCNLSLETQKHTSKIIKDTINPKWREDFNLLWYEDGDDFLHIETRHNDDRITKGDEFLGSVAVDLRDFSPETSHNIWRPLLGEKGVHVGDINLILTITCYTKNNSPSLLNNWNPEPERESQLSEKYNVRNTFDEIKDVGQLTIKVLEAEGLASTDYNRSADPFVVLELTNARVRTLTQHKSLNPQWNQVFHFNVKDMNERLEITINDENDNTKEDFLGKILILLHKVVDGERRWFLLKDKQLWQQANGNNPRILLEMNIQWNPIRAAKRTIRKAETKYMEKDDTKFDFQTLKLNYYRIKKKLHKIEKKVNYFTGRDFDATKKKIESILDWDSKAKSSFICCAFVFVVWMFEIWMIPFALLMIFVLRFVGVLKTKKEAVDIHGCLASKDSESNMDLEDDKGTFAKMKEIGLIAQTNIKYLADIIESVGNVFNFSVPFLSQLAFLAILLLTILLFFVPFRICIICWGLHKLTLRLFLPGHKLFNQSLLNFILAVPNDKMLESCREIQQNNDGNTVNPGDIQTK